MRTQNPQMPPQQGPYGGGSQGPMKYPAGPPGSDQMDEGRGGRKTFSAENIFIGTGLCLLTMLCVIPIWNAASLINDANYVFWVGSSVPGWLIALCVLVIALYAVTIFAFFKYSRPSVRTEQTIMMIANIFITLLGLSLMLLSLPLSRQSIETYNNLMHRCDYSEQTHRMYEYSQVLHNIRATPACASKFSVEECAGYEDAPPYTTFLKAMETDFRCSGFCYKAPATAVAAVAPAPATAAAAPAPATAAAAPAPATALLKMHRHRHHDQVVPLTLEQQKVEKTSSEHKELALVQDPFVPHVYPPTLFSDANYKASCEGMAARDMRNFAGDIGFQTFYQGIYLVLIAIATGFLKLIGFCIRKDTDRELLGSHGRFGGPGYMSTNN